MSRKAQKVKYLGSAIKAWCGRLARRRAGILPVLQGVSWFLGACQRRGMSGCHENDSPPQREKGQGWWVVSPANGDHP